VTAGYSGTPLPRKLGIKAGNRVLVTGAPARFLEENLAGLPDAVTLHVRPSSSAYDVVVMFVRSADELHRKFAAATGRISSSGRLWVAWPRKAGGYASDVCENAIRDLALATGLVDNKVAAFSDAWSGLQVVYRLKDRPALG